MNLRPEGSIVIGIGELGATSRNGESIRTHALGSCVAVIFMDPKTRTVSMAHVALPDSGISSAKAKENPGHFADTAVPALVEAMQKHGYQGTGKGLIVKLVGGAQIVDPNNVFNIGKRNVLAIKKALWVRAMGAVAEDVGGVLSRTVSVDVEGGKVVISTPGKPDREI
ncbi:MAG: chemotaxis protein CheD [Bdellovibrionales bacterium RIFOXYD1_FULL_53_11]|nr:MAG: chemotaxis protein CheD [Bdellovibrionales bacterium RIFOXYD1_FULL_53_11]